ncbi:MAG: type III pantothenate kinase [Bacteroidota bacterium]
MDLALDIGNTITKAGWFEQGQLQDVQAGISPAELAIFIRERSPSRAILSSVTDSIDPWQAVIPENCLCTVLSGTTPLPFQNGYRTPATLGTDRIAAVAGAQARFPQQNVLVIDAGTCITYDLLTNHGIYLGGMISPGLQMRWRAMHTFTARLPLVAVESPKAAEEIPIIGKSTEESLKSGGLLGMAAEIDQIIRRYADKFAALQVVTCGGDMKYLQSWVLSEHVYIPELVLIGLNSIVRHEGS